MKILFIDSYDCSYDTRTYLSRPIGGTQSAVSCLAKTLVTFGHEIAIINGLNQSIEMDGVRFLTLPCPGNILNNFDVIILVSASLGRALRDLGVQKPIVLWSHHAPNQPAIQRLQDPEERASFSGMAFVSEWQKSAYEAIFQIDPKISKVMRNAISPAFLGLSPSFNWLKTGASPVLAHTSTPYRGLDLLLLSFASIRKRIPGTSLRIYSGMNIYGSEFADDHTSLYDLANNMPGVTYVGPLSQPRLADELSRADIWAYPCTFPETSCLSGLEAMASGNLVISTATGALPETTSGYAKLTELPVYNGTSSRMATHYANHFVSAAQEFMATPEQALSALNQQVAYVNTNYRWEDRAKNWIEWLSSLI